MRPQEIFNNPTMKILTVHNSYLQRGGEDVVADMESRLLHDRGHDVRCHRQSNTRIHGMSTVALARATIWAQEPAVEIGRLCDSFQPDLIHAHNTFPLISPSLYWLAARRKIPIVLTLHNFRLLCPQAMFMREGSKCEACLGKVPWRAVTRKCYRDSALQSGAVVAMLVTHRVIGTYLNKVTSFVVPSDFSRRKFIAGGFPQERIHVKPNFVDVNAIPSWSMRSGGLFVGRLSPEKGIEVLIGALDILCRDGRNSGHCNLKVIGAGPMENAVSQHFEERYLGAQPSSVVLDVMRASLFLVVPSTCSESFGLVVIEAFSCGVAVIASNQGALGELVEDGVTGLLAIPGDAADLSRKIQWASAHPERMQDMGRNAYAKYLRSYCASENYRQLMAIYEDAMSSPASPNKENTNAD